MDRDYKNVGKLEDRVIEELSELIQSICKYRRFGLKNYHPITKIVNIDQTKSEIKDVERVLKEYCNAVPCHVQTCCCYTHYPEAYSSEYP